MSSPKHATEATRAANRDAVARLPFPDRRDFHDAAEGLVAPLPDGGVITNARTESGLAVFGVGSCITPSHSSFAPVR